MGLYRNFVWFLHGYTNYTKNGYERASQSFNQNDLNINLTGKHMIVTGNPIFFY